MKHSGLFRERKAWYNGGYKNDGRSGYNAAEMDPVNHADDIEVERYGHQKSCSSGSRCGRLLCYLGLSARRDIELGVVADGPRGERLKKDGCAINGKIYRPAVWTPQEAHDATFSSSA